MHTFDDPVQDIGVGLGETFALALPGNPTTGYTWQADVDVAYLQLVAQEFAPQGPAVGAGGREVFRFRALQAGETELAFEYRRPWGGEARDSRRFRVLIAA